MSKAHGKQELKKQSNYEKTIFDFWRSLSGDGGRSRDEHSREDV